MFIFLRFYRSGSLHILSHLCSMHIHEDLEYWGIDKNLMDACCALIHYPELEISQKESTRDFKNMQLQARIAHEEVFGSSRMGRCRTFLWNLTEYPERSRSARVRMWSETLNKTTLTLLGLLMRTNKKISSCNFSFL